MKNKIIILLILGFFISSCSGFGVKRSDKADEFLIEKKAPLVMPPDIDQLPKPKESIENEETDDFRKVLNVENSKKESSTSENRSSLTENIIKKIEE
tara:strand:+ start:116 stop:406 length:291 start_codon:yes stop_codon:yes gene_type:complete